MQFGDSRRTGSRLAQVLFRSFCSQVAKPLETIVSRAGKMRLIVNGSSIRITHMGPDFLFVEGPIDHPPCEASIFLQVDDSESEWKVRLPKGISKDSTRVELALSQ